MHVGFPLLQFPPDILEAIISILSPDQLSLLAQSSPALRHRILQTCRYLSYTRTHYISPYKVSSVGVSLASWCKCLTKLKLGVEIDSSQFSKLPSTLNFLRLDWFGCESVFCIPIPNPTPEVPMQPLNLAEMFPKLETLVIFDEASDRHYCRTPKGLTWTDAHFAVLPLSLTKLKVMYNEAITGSKFGQCSAKHLAILSLPTAQLDPKTILDLPPSITKLHIWADITQDWSPLAVVPNLYSLRLWLRHSNITPWIHTPPTVKHLKLHSGVPFSNFDVTSLPNTALETLQIKLHDFSLNSHISSTVTYLKIRTSLGPQQTQYLPRCLTYLHCESSYGFCSESVLFLPPKLRYIYLQAARLVDVDFSNFPRTLKVIELGCTTLDGDFIRHLPPDLTRLTLANQPVKSIHLYKLSRLTSYTFGPLSLGADLLERHSEPSPNDSKALTTHLNLELIQKWGDQLLYEKSSHVKIRGRITVENISFQDVVLALPKYITSIDMDFISIWNNMEILTTLPSYVAKISMRHFDQGNVPSSILRHLPSSLTSLTIYQAKDFTLTDLKLLPEHLKRFHINLVTVDDSVSNDIRSMCSSSPFETLNHHTMIDSILHAKSPLLQLEVRNWSFNISENLFKSLPSCITILDLDSVPGLYNDVWIAAFPPTIKEFHYRTDKIDLSTEGLSLLPRGLQVLNLPYQQNFFSDSQLSANMPPGLITLRLDSAKYFKDADVEALPRTLKTLNVHSARELTPASWKLLPRDLTNLDISQSSIDGYNVDDLPKNLKTLTGPRNPELEQELAAKMPTCEYIHPSYEDNFFIDL